MPERLYYVERRLTNGLTGATDYAKPKQFVNLDAAKKEFHNVLSTYIEYGDLIKVAVQLYDDNNSLIMSDVWNKEIVPVTE